MNNLRGKIIPIILFFSDFLLFYLSLYLALFMRNLRVPREGLFESLQYPFLWLFFIWAAVFFVVDFYELPALRKNILFMRGVIVFIVFALLTGSLYFYFRTELNVAPRAILFLTVVNFTLTASLWRRFLLSIFGSKFFQKKVFFVGAPEEIIEILSEEMIDYKVVGFYTNNHHLLEGYKKEDMLITSDIRSIKKIASDVDVLVFSPEIKQNSIIVKDVFSTFPLTVNYIEFFNFYEEIKKKIPLYSVNEWWFLENISKSERRATEFLSRMAEILVSAVALIVFLPLLPIMAVAIKANSSGSVFYRQKRVGKEGKEFTLYKMRTMRQLNDKACKPWREEEKGEVTLTGKVLRKIHIDELPQFYNVLRGDMSLVGPRPEMTELARDFEKKIPFYRLRYVIRPGLTGWAQINYPASTSTQEAEEKFKYDLYYIKNRSLFFDFIIVLKTIRTVF